MKNNFAILRSNVKLYYEYKQNNNVSLLYLQKKYFLKIVNGLKINKQMKRKKRTMVLKAKRFNEKKIKKKIVDSWKFYIIYQKNKRNEYLYAKNKRNEIITKHLIQNLINISSENPKIKDFYEFNNSIDDKTFSNNSFGSQVTFNKNNINNKNKNNNNNNDFYENKNDYLLSSSNNNISLNNNTIDSKYFNNNINNQINNYNNNNNINSSNNKNNIFEDLKGIRNKQRSKPVILDLNDL